MSIAEAYDTSVTRQPLVPPVPPRAPDNMTAFGRIRALSKNPIEAWGDRSYEEDIIQSGLLGRGNLILNAPDAIRHVLVDNYENYVRTPFCHPGAASVPRQGPADRRRPRLETSAPDARAGIHAARGEYADPAYGRCDRRDHCEPAGREQRAGGSARGDAAHDAGDRRPHHVLVRHGPARHGIAGFRHRVWRTAGAAEFPRPGVAAELANAAGFCARALPQTLDCIRRHADGRAPCRRQDRRTRRRATCST